MYVNIVSAICLAILIIEAGAALKKTVLSGRAERIEFLRGYKRGSWALIFLAAMPLYLIGCLDAERGLAESVFDSIGSTVELIVLKYDTAPIAGLLEKNPFYEAVVYTCFVLVTCNALLLTVSLAGQYIWELWRRFVVFISHRDVLIIFGLNEGSRQIYLSDNRRTKTIIDDISKADTDDLYVEKISYVSSNEPIPVIERHAKMALRRIGRTLIVINTGSDEKNVLAARALIRIVSAFSESERKRCFEKLQIYVIGDPEYRSVYEDIISGGFGFVRYVNKYQRIAVDFIDKYPLSKFMTEDHIDTKTALLKRDFDINLAFIGFGKINREIFLTSVANNQFLEGSEREPVLKKVRYHMFDKNPCEKDKHLNHSYYRYKHECRGLDESLYLPLPSLPAEEHFYRTNVGDFEFYEQLRDIFMKNPRDVNFAVISFGNDLENIDMAQKLIEKRREWQLSNLYIFVKSESFRKEDTLIEDEGCYFIGYGADTIYNIDVIVADKIEKMAKKRNESYEVEKKTSAAGKVTDELLEEARLLSESDWYAMSQDERDSNVFACLSIRSKLNLIGLDYVPEDAPGEPLSYEDYIAAYAEGDEPKIRSYLADGKPVVSYSLEFPQSARRTLAIHEHQRWNSYMISRGVVPSTLEQIEKETAIDKKGERKFTKGKNYAERRHGNLTTFEGLVKFRKIVAKIEKKPELDVDVIKYDYQLLDEVFWLLTSTGYKIIKNKPFSI